MAAGKKSSLVVDQPPFDRIQHDQTVVEPDIKFVVLPPVVHKDRDYDFVRECASFAFIESHLVLLEDLRINDLFVYPHGGKEKLFENGPQTYDFRSVWRVDSIDPRDDVCAVTMHRDHLPHDKNRQTVGTGFVRVYKVAPVQVDLTQLESYDRLPKEMKISSNDLVFKYRIVMA